MSHTLPYCHFGLSSFLVERVFKKQIIKINPTNPCLTLPGHGEHIFPCNNAHLFGEISVTRNQLKIDGVFEKKIFFTCSSIFWITDTSKQSAALDLFLPCLSGGFEKLTVDQHVNPQIANPHKCRIVEFNGIPCYYFRLVAEINSGSLEYLENLLKWYSDTKQVCYFYSDTSYAQFLLDCGEDILSKAKASGCVPDTDAPERVKFYALTNSQLEAFQSTPAADRETMNQILESLQVLTAEAARNREVAEENAKLKKIIEDQSAAINELEILKSRIKCLERLLD